jgi:hypothetical protein
MRGTVVRVVVSQLFGQHLDVKLRVRACPGRTGLRRAHAHAAGRDSVPRRREVFRQFCLGVHLTEGRRGAGRAVLKKLTPRERLMNRL